MNENLTRKILKDHLKEGLLKAQQEILVKVDQTLTQDSTGTMVYLQLEAMKINTLKTEVSVAYIDHNTLQNGFENPDDHLFIQSAAEKYGLIFSKAGNGICHQVHLERFGKPGKILLGSDSHTPTGGALGMLSMGSGGLDVAIAMATGEYYMSMPKVCNIHLKGNLRGFACGKDLILYLLKTLGVKGGLGYVFEYSGPGLACLSVTDRATIANMGAELGATGSIFPSDNNTLAFLKAQGRPEDYRPLSADPNALYDKTIQLNLEDITPMVALPHSPDNVRPLNECLPIKVDQVAIGSCTNGSYTDLMKVAHILKGKQVHKDVSLVIAPGSSSVLKSLAKNGALADLITAGARILEAACGPCIGMGQAPKSKGISLRTFNRNFKGRCGTIDAEAYLVSPEIAALSAISGYLSGPGLEDVPPKIDWPHTFETSEAYFIYPKKTGLGRSLIMGPNIQPFPLARPLEKTLNGRVLLKTNDNVTTDDIMPSNANLLPLRSNIPMLSRHCFTTLSDNFYDLCKTYDGGFIIGGDNYGQGSSREHAALAPLALGIRAVICKSFARIHRSNLINVGILPLVFEDLAAADAFDALEEVTLEVGDLEGPITAYAPRTGKKLSLIFEGSPREKAILRAGGYLNYKKEAF